MSRADDFRKDLMKIMPNYRWTIHKTNNPQCLTATGIQSSGFNRLSTLQVRWAEHDKDWGGAVFEATSAAHGTRSPWVHSNKDRTLARALRGLQQHYEWQAQHYRVLAARLQEGRQAPAALEGGGA